MDVTLKVIEGAKVGAKLAIKKNEFVIGRSNDCHLCAGSSAVSRRHCAIMRTDNRVSIKDLGSRNGTLINGEKIAAEVELASGDEISVGPLKFLVTITAGIANAKRAEVKSVAEAVERAAVTPTGDASVDDIAQWLTVDPSALNETQTIRIDDTNAAHINRVLEAETSEIRVDAPSEESQSDIHADEHADENGKKGAGKLPKLPLKPTSKDSREAAAEALRAWSRRR